MFEIIRDWFFLRRLRNHKLRALFEVQKDLEYLYEFKREMINFDEETARKRMAELKKIAEPTDEEAAELGTLINQISQSKAVKNEVEQSVKLVQDLENYISLL